MTKKELIEFSNIIHPKLSPISKSTIKYNEVWYKPMMVKLLGYNIDYINKLEYTDNQDKAIESLLKDYPQAFESFNNIKSNIQVNSIKKLNRTEYSKLFYKISSNWIKVFILLLDLIYNVKIVEDFTKNWDGK